ncbi:Crp/Fnr family transcriptional regulator [Streptomyces hoynatensis]|uniref:Crp/Fnr family transcriptional regulator n=1 Tax=Streptomyces hoynatensis TaxID=1141874 RepID=UPI001F4E557C|nr:Crp/Fnr family transcriptional regulator [Streptomyces hoynatensis]
MLSQGVWEEIVREGWQRRYAAGDMMLRQGSPGTHLLACTAGLAKVVQHRPDGAVLWLAFRGPGELLGEVSVLSTRGEPRSADVVAVTECVTQVLDAARFRRFVEERGLGADLLQQAMDRTRESDEYRAELVTLSVSERLARTLLRLSVLADSRQLTGLTQEELAQAVGGSRNGVAEGLQRLRAAGAVETARRVIGITDLGVLRRWAGCTCRPAPGRNTPGPTGRARPPVPPCPVCRRGFAP